MRRRSKDWARYGAYPSDGVELLRAHYVAHRYEPHIHETYAFGLVEGGRQTFACRGERHYSTGGSVFAINPGDAHDGEAADEGGFLYRMIYIEPAIIAQISKDAGVDGLPLFRTAMFFDGAAARLLAEAHDAYAQGASQLERDHRLQAFILHIVRHAGLASRDKCTLASSALKRVRDHMQARFQNDVSLADLAAVAELGRHHLTRSFTRTFGIAPHRYLTQLRLAEARRLLRIGSSIAEAATFVGFADQSHLTRRFKRAYGITPRQYQREVTNVQ